MTFLFWGSLLYIVPAISLFIAIHRYNKSIIIRKKTNAYGPDVISFFDAIWFCIVPVVNIFHTFIILDKTYILNGNKKIFNFGERINNWYVGK